MDKKKLLKFGLFVFVGMFIWGAVVSKIIRFFLPDADLLQIYLIDKGVFAVLLLGVMAKFGGFKFFGLERGTSWWFLVPGLPFILLGVLVFFAPNATFGLGVSATVGWILVALFVGIGEEGVFRGILWRAFESRGTLVTAFATSALFGTVHLMGLFTDIPWQIIVSLAIFAFGGGMMFAAVRLVSGSLLAPIVLHTVFDAGALIAAGGATEMFDETWSVERLVIPGVVFAVWGLACILIIENRRSKRHRAGHVDGPAIGERSVNKEARMPV